MCDVNKLFKEIAQYRTIKAEAEAELERLEGEIKEFMLEQEKTLLVGEEHTAKYFEVTTNRIDTTRLKKEMPNIARAYTKPSTSMRFTFS